MRTSESCACGGSFSGSRSDWLIWRKAHDCKPDENLGKQVYGSDSWMQIQTQDGRWLFDRETPDVR